jgi:hypothetical protein
MMAALLMMLLSTVQSKIVDRAVRMTGTEV